MNNKLIIIELLSVSSFLRALWAREAWHHAWAFAPETSLSLIIELSLDYHRIIIQISLNQVQTVEHLVSSLASYCLSCTNIFQNCVQVGGHLQAFWHENLLPFLLRKPGRTMKGKFDVSFHEDGSVSVRLCSGKVDADADAPVEILVSATSPAQVLRQIASGELPAHYSKKSLTKKSVQIAMRKAAWSEGAWTRFRAWLLRPKRALPLLSLLPVPAQNVPVLLALPPVPPEAAPAQLALPPVDAAEEASSSDSSSDTGSESVAEGGPSGHDSNAATGENILHTGGQIDDEKDPKARTHSFPFSIPVQF